MNNEFYQYALGILDNLTTDELEAGLKAFGIECQRKVFVFEEEDIDLLAQAGISSTSPISHRLQDSEAFDAICSAANDNSYALAA